MKRIRQLLAKNSLITGTILLCLIMLGVVLYMWRQDKNQKIDITVQTEAMERESTIDSITDSIEAARYILSAYADSDMDKMLRGCAITERAAKVSTEKIVEEEGCFSVDTTLPPSGQYWEYVPAAQTILLQEYEDLYEAFLEEAGRNAEINVLRVDYYEAAEQKKADAVRAAKQRSEFWGAEYLTDVIALLEIDGETYATDLCMVKYWGTWKLFAQGTELFTGAADSENGTDALLYQMDATDYRKLVSSQSQTEAYREQLQVDTADEESGKEDKETEDSVEEELLPLNYTLYDRIYGTTAEETIEKFYLAIKKRQVNRAICYSSNTTLDSENIGTFVERQKDFCMQMVKMYYHIVFREIPDVLYLEEAGMTGNEVVSWLSTEEIRYIKYEGCEWINENGNTAEYLVFLQYNGEHLIMGCTLEETENGWSILSLSSETAGYGIGEIR